MYVSPGPSAHPGPRAFWLGGGCKGARGTGSVGDVGEGPPDVMRNQNDFILR